ncbi:hypothetical protein RJ640_026707 [Escallonia rubra]|uniref:F-box/LRR-repeat protein 15/At3g58940/PEG3-like LRR domain-containing protein n=1 Tax=Escallonia rubra TaxID=112253 RepID=A0AA88QU56_9ASTE|nr:hypothetical protein RJ640_026707 [Escallonia rubra]
MGHRATVDRFSVLPWELLDNIIGRLHILDAVRTTILSRSWKDKWAGVSKVVFDEYSGGTAFEDGEKFVKLVHHVLLSHHGQIQKFMISVRPNFDTNYLDRWILLLSTNAIEELVLDFNKKQLTRTIYKLPSSLFSCQQLRHLHLTDCKVVLPDTFHGFSNLASLQLSRFSAYDGKVVERLIRSCPLLDALALSWFSFDHLDIYAPNLKSLYLEGDFAVYIENSPHLTDASFLLVPIERDVREMAKSSGPSDCQFQLGKLALSGWYMEYLAIRCIPVGAFVECNTLKLLKLSLLHFDVMDEISVLFSFLGRCSNLEELDISGPTPRRVNEDVCVISFMLSTLRSTSNLEGFHISVSFLKFLDHMYEMMELNHLGLSDFPFTYVYLLNRMLISLLQNHVVPLV